MDQALAFWGFQSAPASISKPERGERFQLREQKRAFKSRERELDRGQTMRFFNRPVTGTP